jgi:hypothetical protein
MVTHVLVNNTSRDVNSLVVWNLQEHLTEAFQSLLELISLVEHQTQMESTTDEVFLPFQGFQIHLNSSLVQIVLLKSSLLEDLLSLSLKSQTFCMIKLCIIRRKFDCFVVVSMSLFKLLLWRPVQVYVTSIEDDGWIIWIQINRLVKIRPCLL